MKKDDRGDWHPIATVPDAFKQEGRELLLTDGRSVRTGHWASHAWSTGAFNVPTHWMPLPNPPGGAARGIPQGAHQMTEQEELIAELDDALGAGGIHDLAFHVGQVKALVKHHSELLAARDHLRARLQQVIDKWTATADDHEATIPECEAKQLLVTAAALRGEALTCRACAADLLAVLTEPPQVSPGQNIKEHAVTRSAKTDVDRKVSLPQRED